MTETTDDAVLRPSTMVNCSTDYYVMRLACENCGQQNLALIKKGMSLATVDLGVCDNCGCAL